MSNIYSGPTTSLHYAPNANIVGNTYAPGAAGFNLADISSPGSLAALPPGVQALVYVGMTNGVTPAFKAAVQGFLHQPQVYGFYLADEPIPGQVSAANLKAESDYVHQVDPGAKTFIAEYNNGSPRAPSYSFTPANTDIDLFGLDPYPVRPQFAGGVDYSVINDAVNAAESEGIPQAAIVPVYQAFGATSGAYSSWGLPTAAQAEQMLSTWGSLVPNPAFDYAYSWGTQAGDTALVDYPELRQVFSNTFASETAGPVGPGTGPGASGAAPSVSVTDSNTGQTVTITTSGTTTVGSGTITLTSRDATAVLGTDSFSMRFVNVDSLILKAGAGTDTVSQSSGRGSFTAGSGSLTVTGAPDAADVYAFSRNSGHLTIEDFSLAKGDSLTVASGLRRGFTDTTDGNGGTLLTFPAAGHGHTIDLVGVSSLPKSAVHFG